MTNRAAAAWKVAGQACYGLRATAPYPSTVRMATYASLPAVRAAYRLHDARPAGLLVVDEAHRTAGPLGKASAAVHDQLDMIWDRRRLAFASSHGSMLAKLGGGGGAPKADNACAGRTGCPLRLSQRTPANGPVAIAPTPVMGSRMAVWIWMPS